MNEFVIRGFLRVIYSYAIYKYLYLKLFFKFEIIFKNIFFDITKGFDRIVSMSMQVKKKKREMI